MNAEEIEFAKEFIERIIKYENVLLKWITMNMVYKVTNLIDPMPSYKIYHNNKHFEYIFNILNECVIKCQLFNDEYVSFSISKDYPNSLTYWLYFDLKTDKLECTDIPGEYLLLMFCFNIAAKILKACDYVKELDKPKQAIIQIIDNYDIDSPQYIKFLKPYQYRSFKNFLNKFKYKILLDEYFIDNMFNIDVLTSKYLSRSFLYGINKN